MEMKAASMEGYCFRMKIVENGIASNKKERVFDVGPKIGGGTFGDVHIATDIDSGEDFAVKLENRKLQYLKKEVKIYKELIGLVGFPRVELYGRFTFRRTVMGITSEYVWNMMAMNLLGSTLNGMFKLCNLKFSLKTVLLLADQLIARLQTLHRRGYIHRDIKPENLVMGMGREASTVFMIDLGLAKHYMDRKTKEYLIDYEEGLHLCGTAKYISLNVHQGIQPDCRDDLIALGYVLINFLRGNLPWGGIGRKVQDYKEAIHEMKAKISMEELCKGHPHEFADYMNYCSGLKFGEKPDYLGIRIMFRKLCFRKRYFYDNCFDWNELDLRGCGGQKSTHDERNNKVEDWAKEFLH